MNTWQIMAPHGILHVVRGEAGLRALCKEYKVSYDRLAKHVEHKPLGKSEAIRPSHAKGWRLLRDSQWLSKDGTVFCVVGATSLDFIRYANSCTGHPICGAFAEDDKERLAHLLNSGWIFSSCGLVAQDHWR